MRLALALGMSERQCKKEILPDEFYRWVAFDELEGIGRKAENIQAAVIAAAICRASGGGKAKAKEFIRDEPEWWHEGETLADEFRRAFGR